MDDGIEVLVTPGGKVDQRDAEITGFGIPFAAINGDSVSALD
jgi:hypothetical protein